MSNCNDWVNKSSRCPKAAEGFEPYHKWMPVSTQNGKVSMIMCGICFHEVNIEEAFNKRECFKT